MKHYQQTLCNQTFSTSSATQVSGAKKESIKISRCCIASATFCSMSGRGFAFTKPHNSSCLAAQWGWCWWRQVSDGEGSWWRGGSCSRADKEQHMGDRGRVREGEEVEMVKGLQVDFLHPARSGASEDVLNLLSTFVLRPRQGGWKWGEGWRGGHKSAPFRLKTGFK